MLRSAFLILASAVALSPPLAAESRRAPVQQASTGPQQISCDMLSFAGQLDRATSRELVPTHTLDAAAAVLTRHNVTFTRERGTLTFGQMPKKLFEDLNRLPPGEPIILPNQDGGAICVLVPGGDTY